MNIRTGSTSLCVAVAWACSIAIAVPAYSKGPVPRFTPPPRNVILIIGDGMDYQQITAARNYLVGAFGQLDIDRLPKRSAAQVLTIDEASPHNTAYVADSANGGTTLATGTVTSAGRIGTTVEDADVTNILELAKTDGYRVGVVTSASVTDATPAAFLAHVSFRSCEGPVDMYPGVPPGAPPGTPSLPGCLADQKAVGGKGSIAEQIATSKADVVLGGGTGKFGQTIEEGGKSVLQLALEQGFQYVNNPAALDAVQSGRVLGLFASSTLPVKFTGPPAVKMMFDSAGNPTTSLPGPGSCSSNPLFAGVPSLTAMTDKAIKLLSSNNQRGFFLMVESASVDKEAHRRNACGHIGEMQQLDEVVDMVRDYADGHPGTLVIVTADHGQAVQVLNDASFGGGPVTPMGYVTRLVTPSDGSILRIGYATSNGPQEDHTGTEVPVLMYGGLPGAFLKPFMWQSDVFLTMAKHLNVDLD